MTEPNATEQEIATEDPTESKHIILDPVDGTGEGDPSTEGEGKQGFDVVLDSEDSQPKKGETPAWVMPRIKSQAKKKREAEHRATQLETELAAEREKNKIYQLRIQQDQNAVPQTQLPNPDDFDGGVHDPGYVKQWQTHQNSLVRQEIQQQVAQVSQVSQRSVSQHDSARDLEQKQKKHYEKAQSLSVADYGEVEDKFIDNIGERNHEQLITFLDPSDTSLLFYFLGKNKGKTEYYRDLLESNPVKGMAELGKLAANLKLKPKTETIPSPDAELQGSGGSSDTAMQRQLEKLREAVSNGTKKMGDILALKRKAEAKGIILE